MHTLQLFYFNQNTNGENVMIPYNTLNVPQHHQIVHDCNGLLLLEYDRLKNCHYVYNPTTKELKRHPKQSYYVYNPTTKRSRELTLPHSDKFPYVEAINLAFDPSKSPYYKVVCVRCPSEPESFFPTYQNIEVYDSKSHTWKLGLGPFKHPRISKGVHWNNSIYWRTNQVGYSIFDLATNEIKRLSHPPRPYAGNYNSFEHLLESDGHLYHFKLMDKRRVSIALWELGGDDRSQWLYKHRGVLHQHNNTGTTPIRFMGDGTRYCLVTYEPGVMMAYNLHHKSYDVLVDLTCLPNFMMFDDIVAMTGFQFGEILALV